MPQFTHSPELCFIKYEDDLPNIPVTFGDQVFLSSSDSTCRMVQNISDQRDRTTNVNSESRSYSLIETGILLTRCAGYYNIPGLSGSRGI